MEDVPICEKQDPSWHDAYDKFIETFMNQNSLLEAYDDKWGINSNKNIQTNRQCSAMDLTEALATYLHEVCGYPAADQGQESSAWQRAETIVSGRDVIDDARNQEPAPVVLDCLVQGAIAGITSQGSLLNAQDKINLFVNVNEYLAGSDAKYHIAELDHGIEVGETTIEARKVLKDKLLICLIGLEQSLPALPDTEAKHVRETIALLHRMGISRKIGVMEMARVAVVAIYR